MSYSRREPFVLVHLASASLIPIWMLLCLLGFTAGDPLFPFDLDYWFVITLGGLPILVMQLWRPFYIFSLLVVTLQPESLTKDQRRLLAWFRQPGLKLLSLIFSYGLGWLIWQGYLWAPLFATVSPVEGWYRIEGLGLAAISTLGLSFCTLVPLSLVLLLQMEPERIDSSLPYEIKQIEKDFSCLGFAKAEILPGILMTLPETQSDMGKLDRED